VLSPDQIEQIHLTALQVLEEVGIWLPNREMLEILHNAAGAWVDFDAQTVLVPSYLVESSIERFPPGFAWHARQSANSLEIYGTDTYFTRPVSNDPGVL
jgi:trimethylamine:corrinoid methyltransferase-like protein